MFLRKKLHFLALYEFLPLGFGDFLRTARCR